MSLLAAGVCQVHAGDQPPVEVLHWWAAGGAPLNGVRADLGRRGFAWKDSAPQGGEERKLLFAKARNGMGQLPDALQLHSFSLRESAARYVSWDALAAAEHWDQVLPVPLQQAAKVGGHWRAVPLNIQRSNWIWANKAIFDELKLTPPTTFDELLEVARRVKAAGYLPLAHGTEPWLHTLMFDNAVLAVGGPVWYRKALVEQDPVALASPKMVTVFEQVRALSRLAEDNAKGRASTFATDMVVSRKAAMQLMGDWTKGEFSKRGQQARRDFICFPYPGTAGSYVFVADLFAMPDLGPARREGQQALARTLMDPDTQKAFNLAKGSIPARNDVPLDEYDDCARQSARDLQAAAKRHTLVSRFVAETPETLRNAVTAVVTQFVESDEPAASAAARLERALRKS